MSKNFLSFDNRTNDLHGGRAEEHRAEMEEIARRVYAEERAKDMERIECAMHEIARAAYEQAVKDFLGALDYDVTSITRIGFDGCRDIFEDKKTQQYISDHIMKEIQKRLNGKSFRK